ncbi:MAG: hypothetical protein ACHQK9_19420 [Reyranellales bacterium]
MRLFLAALLVLAAIVPASTQTKPPLPADDLAGEWRGQWTSPSGYFFTTTLKLQVAADGTAQGQFVWLLLHTPLPQESKKLGMHGTEFVSGRVDKAAKSVTLAGTRKEDPDDVIFTDSYRMIVSENGRTMGGVSRNLGDWDGQIFLAR